MLFNWFKYKNACFAVFFYNKIVKFTLANFWSGTSVHLRPGAVSLVLFNHSPAPTNLERAYTHTIPPPSSLLPPGSVSAP